VKTAIVGGGKGCRAILKLLDAGRLRELAMDVAYVVDPDDDAPAMRFARRKGIATLADFTDAFADPDIQLVVELTGDQRVLDRIYHDLPAGVRVIDHLSARIFWDLLDLERKLREELRARAALEEELALDRQRAQDILDSLPDLVIVLAPDKRIRVTNRRFFLETNVDPEEAIGQKCSSVFCSAGDDGEESACAFEHAVATGQPYATIVERKRPKPGFFEVTAVPRYDGEGNLYEIVETHHPVTTRISLQREVERSEHLFRLFIESALDIISIKDRDGRYMVTNPASAGLFGLEPSDCVGKSAAELYDPDIAKLINQHDREVMHRRKALNYNETYVIGGRERQFETLRFPLLDREGNVEGVCTIARDVTHRVQLQNQVLQSAKLAAVGKLAAGVAHEINNPLTGVLAYAEELLEDADENDGRRADYEVIIRETLRCRDIVRNLLDFSRQEAPVLQCGELNDVVRRTLPLVEKLPRFRDIELHLDLADEGLGVDADSRQLQQVLLNLIMNAADAMNGVGSIQIETGSEGGKGFISVSDSGPGVPDADKSRIFEPFYSTKTTTGLGLSVSWGIVERHGGVIELGDSRFGGARFRIVLPLTAAQPGAAQP
jgi:two-component system NtrC family sensor kinase